MSNFCLGRRRDGRRFSKCAYMQVAGARCNGDLAARPGAPSRIFGMLLKCSGGREYMNLV